VTFLNSAIPFVKRGQGETPQLGQPAEQSQKSQVKMYPGPQIHCRIQGQRLIFHFNPLATQWLANNFEGKTGIKKSRSNQVKSVK